MKLISYLTFILVLLFSGSSFARGLSFGDQDKLSFIQEVKLKGAKGEVLHLGYRITTKFFLAGVWLTDQGYILADKNNKEKAYYTLTADQMSSYQAKGLLPNPLPKYEIQPMDYVFGYSLWLLLIILATYYGIKYFINKNKQEISED